MWAGYFVLHFSSLWDRDCKMRSLCIVKYFLEDGHTFFYGVNYWQSENDNIVIVVTFFSMGSTNRLHHKWSHLYLHFVMLLWVLMRMDYLLQLKIMIITLFLDFKDLFPRESGCPQNPINRYITIDHSFFVSISPIRPTRSRCLYSQSLLKVTSGPPLGVFWELIIYIYFKSLKLVDF